MNRISTSVPDTQAFGLKVGDTYPVEGKSNAIMYFPSQCEPWYIAPSPTYASSLGTYFEKDGERRLKITYPDGTESNSAYLEYSPNNSEYGKQEKIAAIQIRCY